MYWPIGKAKEELKKRQSDQTLIAKVDEFLGNCPIPSGLNAFLARHIASARFEDLEFEQKAQQIGLEPICLEYQKDIFVSNNPSKTRLVRLLILAGYGKKGGPQLVRVNLVTRDLNEINGFPLSKILTKWGEPLVEFHRRIRVVTNLNNKIIDLSSWLKSIGRAREYYRYFLAAFLVRGILFENFESPGFSDLDLFCQKVVLPAWRWVQDEFGYSPLIVRYPDTSPEEEKRILNWYPSAVLKAIPED